MTTKRPTVIDLFAGVGGLSLGASRAGFRVAGAVDSDSHANAAHSKNFPNCIHLAEDIATLDGQELAKKLGLTIGEIAGVVGGPPCQGFSTMGHRNAHDPRNECFSHFFRIVNEVAPRFFVAENVPGIAAKKNRFLREAAFAMVRDKYTLLPPLLLKASDYGAPTSRARVFFIGYLRDDIGSLTEDNFAAAADVEATTVKDALRGLPVKINPEWQTEADGWRIAKNGTSGHFVDRLRDHVPQGAGDAEALRRLRLESRVSGCLGTRHTPEVVKRFARVEPGKIDKVSKFRRLELSGFCPTLRAGTGRDRGSYQAARPIHPTQDRVITPREAARLQGFPDWFRFSPDKWHSFMQIGNSVSPILAERILRVIYMAFR